MIKLQSPVRPDYDSAYLPDSPSLASYAAHGYPIFDRIGELLPAPAVTEYQVIEMDTIISHHRSAWRAYEAAHKRGCYAYAVFSNGMKKHINYRAGDVGKDEIALSDTMMINGHQHYRNPHGDWLLRQSKYSYMPTLAIKA